MYLISIYFDEQTDKIIRNYIRQVSVSTGNRFMIDNRIPPHITISAFETKNEEQVIHNLKEITKHMQTGFIQWATVGQFFPYVIYLAPVLSKYLHDLSDEIYSGLSNIENINFSPYYRPFQWFPHTTIGKQLAFDEMKKAFDVLQGTFAPFSGQVVRIGLAKTNPYTEIWEIDFTEKKC